MESPAHLDRNTQGKERDMNNLEVSSLVRKFGAKVVCASHGKPILDVACGSGRNAFFLSSLGATVVCMDKELTRLREYLAHNGSKCFIEGAERLVTHQIDLVKAPWPFDYGSAGGIINVHFTLPALFPFFANSLIPSGYLLLETVPGCGDNFMELPKKGELKTALEANVEFEMYEEKPVGPAERNAVTVKLVARRRARKRDS
jgi:SAM-dependent methyltransferase